jgi:hypothetical protein
LVKEWWKKSTKREKTKTENKKETMDDDSEW